jgi:hypothetical protein
MARQSSSPLELRRLHSLDDPAFAQLLEIYFEANDRSERKSLNRLAAMIQDPGYHFLAGMRSGLVTGFQILRVLDGADAALLEYNAVACDRRNQGIGSELFQRIANLDVFASRFLLAEVGSDKKATPDQLERTRRKEFYRRLGWREVDQLRYIMPPVSSALPPEMDMLVYAPALPAMIERDRLRHWLERCYIDVYGLSATDARIDAMISGLPEQVPLN